MRVRPSYFGRASGVVVTCLAICGGVSPITAQEKKTPLPPPQAVVNYNDPPREYTTTRAGTWTIKVEKQLLADAPAVAKKAQTRLRKKLGEAIEALPDASHARLKELDIFLMYGPKSKGGGRDNGLEYFQKTAPEHHKDLDPGWGSSMVVYCAENYVQISDFWAVKALVHEMAHAHHLEQWPENQPDILQAWENAMKLGLYHGVKDDEGKIVDKAYATVNQLEYFAELSCMYFVGCNYQPFDREELKTYDPKGYAMIEQMWDVKSQGPGVKNRRKPVKSKPKRLGSAR
jgi:hypothetical protein